VAVGCCHAVLATTTVATSTGLYSAVVQTVIAGLILTILLAGGRWVASISSRIDRIEVAVAEIQRDLIAVLAFETRIKQLETENIAGHEVHKRYRIELDELWDRVAGKKRR
jgi:hypothetical protein